MYIQNGQQPATEWLADAKEISDSGKFTTKETSIILEWKKTDIQSPDLAAFKRQICDLACQTLAPIEVQFLKAYPQAVSQEMFLKPCSPFFEKGDVDWDSVEATIQSTMKQFYLTDLASFGPAVIKPLLDDVYFLVSIKENAQLLGFAMFAITPALPFGNVKLINLALKEESRGLDQLLMSSIFKILPKTERVFLFVRPTNETALKTYTSWGFARDLNPAQDPNHKANLDYLHLFEYRADKSNTLQATAAKLD